MSYSGTQLPEEFPDLYLVDNWLPFIKLDELVPLQTTMTTRDDFGGPDHMQTEDPQILEIHTLVALAYVYANTQQQLSQGIEPGKTPPLAGEVRNKKGVINQLFKEYKKETDPLLKPDTNSPWYAAWEANDLVNALGSCPGEKQTTNALAARMGMLQLVSHPSSR